MIYDVLVLGGGPVGCFAAYLANNKGLKTGLIESTSFLGGQPLTLFPQKQITDYPLFPHITAKKMVEELISQLKSTNEVDIFLNKQLTSFNNNETTCTLTFNNNQTLETKYLIIASGNGSFFPNQLEIPGSFNNENIQYIVENYAKYNGKSIIILGGGDSAVDWANNLAMNTKSTSISIVHRRDIFRANGENVNSLQPNGVNIYLNKECLEIKDNNKLVIKDNLTHKIEELFFNKLIVQYGQKINNGLIEPILNLINHNEGNKIFVNHSQQTNIENIYAIGNACIYNNRPNMIITGHGEASSAINDIILKIKKYEEHKPA